jgi:hypothetical protein
MTYYEKNQFSNVDINQIKDINEVEKLVTQTEIKNIGKEFAKQIHVDLENDTWCVLRPLTHESSVKYGSSTRWCTASKNNPYQFFNSINQRVINWRYMRIKIIMVVQVKSLFGIQKTIELIH